MLGNFLDLLLVPIEDILEQEKIAMIMTQDLDLGMLGQQLELKI